MAGLFQANASTRSGLRRKGVLQTSGPRDPDKFDADDDSQREFRQRFIPSGLANEIFLDVYERLASFEPKVTNFTTAHSLLGPLNREVVIPGEGLDPVVVLDSPLPQDFLGNGHGAVHAAEEVHDVLWTDRQRQVAEDDENPSVIPNRVYASPGTTWACGGRPDGTQPNIPHARGFVAPATGAMSKHSCSGAGTKPG